MRKKIWPGDVINIIQRCTITSITYIHLLRNNTPVPSICDAGKISVGIICLCDLCPWYVLESINTWLQINEWNSNGCGVHFSQDIN